MAGPRLIAIAMMGAMSCRCGPPSKHEPGAGPAALHSGITPPAGWMALPALATAAQHAATAITVAGSEAWGEPARGCYAAWLALRGGGAPTDQMADQLLQSLTIEPALKGITVRDVVKGAAGPNGVMAFAFEVGVYHGRLHAQLDRDGSVRALACFWNQREPAACEQACTRWIGNVHQ